MEYQKNADGTDKLDEQGNPIPVEITTEGKEAAEKAQLVEELKELRLKNGIMKDLLDAKPKEPEPQPKVPVTEEEKLEALLDKKLQEREALNAQANKIAAFEKFIADNKEFHPENDLTGLKRDALQKKFNSFNTTGLTTVEQFLTVIGDAKKLLVGNDSQQDTSKGTQIPNSPTPKGSPSGKQDEVLTPKELKLAESTGRTKEQILKIKLKHPELLNSLLEYVRD